MSVGGVDLDLLADYAGGALDGTPQAATVERLVATDPAWTRAYAELRVATESVRTQLSLLGTVDDLMPADVVARLDTALESADAGTSLPALDSGPTTEGGLADRVAPLRAVPDSPDDHDEPGEAGGDRTVVPLAGRRRWVRWAAPAAVAAAVLALVGLGVNVFQQSSKSGDSTTASTQDKSANAPAQAGDGTGSAEAAPQWTSTGTNYQADTVRSAVGAQALAGPARAVPGATAGDLKSHSLGEDASVPAELRDFTAQAALTACLNAIAAEHGRPPTSFAFVDLARFGGSPALVVSLVGGDGQRWVWVSGPQCGRGSADTRFSAPAG